MDKDTDLAYVNQGNYVDANDIRHRQTDGNTFGGIMSIVGNTLTNTIPDYTTSNKKFRVFLDITELYDGSVGSISFTWKTQENGSAIIGIAPPNTATTIGSLATFASTVYTTITTLVAYTPVGTFAFTTTKTIGGNVYAGYFDIEFTGNTVDYKLWVENTISNAASIFVTQDYIPTAADKTFKVIGSQQLDQDLYIWLASVTKSSGIISMVSEMGVLSSSDNGVTFTYTRLIRSKNLGFSTDRRVEATLERNGSEINMYWTDGYNKPRAMYLKNSLKNTTDGLLYAVGGYYELENIDIDTAFFNINTTSYLEFNGVTSGGAITSGNKRYTGRFLTADFVPTDFLYPTNPVNIYKASTAIPSLITGDADGTITDKTVNLTIKNIPSNVYKYFELVAIEYADQIYTAKIVQRFALSLDQQELKVQHTNLGQENIPLGNNELLAITSKYLTVQNMKIFDNRMVLSNLTEQIDTTLEAWAQTITHSLETKATTSLGFLKPSDFANEGLTNWSYRFGEHLDPKNTYDFSSYMMNDTYRFAIQVQWKNTGKWSAPYWVDDIRFDTSASNVVGTRRTANNINVNLTDDDNTTVNNYYIKFANIQLDYAVGSSYIRDLIVGFRFVRAKRIPEVLTTGYFLPGTFNSSARNKQYIPYLRPVSAAGFVTTLSTGTAGINTTTNVITFGAAHNLVKGQTLFFQTSGTPPAPLEDETQYYAIIVSSTQIKLAATSDLTEIDLTTVGTGTFNFNTILESDAVANYPISGFTNSNGSDELFFYSIDDYYLGSEYEFNTALDELRILGVPNAKMHFRGARTTLVVDAGEYVDFNGYFMASNNPYLRIADSGTAITLSAYNRLEEGESKKLSTGRNLYNGLNSCPCVPCEEFTLSAELKATVGSNFTGLANSENAGIYYGQLFRNLGANKKYPANKELTQYESIGHYYILAEGQTGTISNVSVYGGDVFNQKTHMHVRLKNAENFSAYGFGVYSQNKINAQMFNYLEGDGTLTGEPYVFPQYQNYPDASNTLTGIYNYILKYDTRFNALTSTIEWAQYEPTTQKSIAIPLIYWLTQDRKQSYYSRAYDYKDDTILEQGYNSNTKYDGTIPNRIVWSAKKVIGSQKDNYRIFKPLDFAELDLTLGPIAHHEVINAALYTWQPYSVQRQYFRDASLIGAQQGTDVVVGSGSILGSPGQEVTSIGLFKKWSYAKGKNQSGKDTFYWYNDQLQKVVRFGQDGTRVISDKGMISYLTNNGKYVSNQDYPLTGLGVHGVWNDKYSEAIFTFKYNDGSSNKQFTLVYDEIKNGFIGFHSYYPNIYLPYKNTFFSPNPSVAKTLYLHDRGSESTYYGTYAIPSITGVMNYEPNVSKNFEALQFVTDTQPYDVYLTTTNHVSYLDETEFVKREDLWYSPIKNDSTSTGLNNGDTSRLWGKWLKVKMTFEASSGKQKLINFIVKFRAMTRLYNQ
jgi:hypothetical protein